MLTFNSCGFSDNIDSNTMLENSLIAKEKFISELNMELHNIETTLSNEREEHINEIKKLNALLHEKVCFLSKRIFGSLHYDGIVMIGNFSLGLMGIHVGKRSSSLYKLLSSSILNSKITLPRSKSN